MREKKNNFWSSTIAIVLVAIGYFYFTHHHSENSGQADIYEVKENHSSGAAGENLPMAQTPVRYKGNNEDFGIEYQVFVRKLNVREKPTTKSKVIARLGCGDIVKGIYENGIPKNWLKVKLEDGKSGYVYKPFVWDTIIHWGDVIELTNDDRISKISFEWWKGDYVNSLHYFSVKIENKSCFSLQNFLFEIKEFSETGTLLDTIEHIEYKEVKPFQTRNLEFHVVGHSQTTSASLRVAAKVVF
jgi:hypothetical protein